MNRLKNNYKANMDYVEIQEKELPYKIFEDLPASSVFHVYLNSEIVAPCEYTDLVHLIRSLNPNDTMYLYINTNGGQLDTTLEIVNAITESQGTVIGVGSGNIISAGVLLFLSCHGQKVENFVRLMAHDYSSGYGGSGNKVYDEVVADREHYSEVISTVCEGFMDEDEITAFMGGKDLWMNAEEVGRRLEKRDNHFKNEMVDGLDNLTKLLLHIQDNTKEIDDESYEFLVDYWNDI